MPENVYLKLREFLDQFPLGFPQTESGVEIKILKRLFTEKEAETALLLTPFPEEAFLLVSPNIGKSRLGVAIQKM